MWSAHTCRLPSVHLGDTKELLWHTTEEGGHICFPALYDKLQIKLQMCTLRSSVCFARFNSRASAMHSCTVIVYVRMQNTHVTVPWTARAFPCWVTRSSVALLSAGRRGQECCAPPKVFYYPLYLQVPAPVLQVFASALRLPPLLRAHPKSLSVVLQKSMFWLQVLTKMWIALVVSGSFMVFQFVGGYITGRCATLLPF